VLKNRAFLRRAVQFLVAGGAPICEPAKLLHEVAEEAEPLRACR